jgi:predicted acetyltransferase
VEIDVRTIGDNDVPAWSTAVTTGFFSPVGDADSDLRRQILLLDRTWGAFEGDRVVATLRSFPSDVTVPGGAALPAAAVTAVTTTSTHRRRGLASRLVLADLAAARDRGEQLAVLIAAEWPIYGRFGYGAATEHQTLTIDTVSGRLRQPAAGTVEYVDEKTARAVAAEVYEPHRRQRPGEMSRADWYWDLDLGILHFPSWGERKPCFQVLARDPAGAPVGLALYRYEDKHEHRLPGGEVDVHRMFASNPAGAALLWQHLLSLDLTVRVRVEDRPVDDPLPWLLTDPRRARVTDRADFLWVRPLDVAGLLAARRYPAAGQVVLEVGDPAGFAAGRFALDAGPDGASCAPTTRSADLTLSAGALGSVYLGGYPLRTLALAGLVDEHSAGAVDRADAMFRSAVAPWCSGWF